MHPAGVPGSGSPPDRLTHLTVERLDVVGPDGQLVLSRANGRRLPQPLIGGQTLETGRAAPGLIFFDGRGWEVGGLIYQTGEPGGPVDAGAQLSFELTLSNGSRAMTAAAPLG
jgi:hypothetical protein